ncbi:MAG: hypothetical protein Q9161_002025 [Pseudevernia consocians]
MPSATPTTTRPIISDRSVDTVRPREIICIGAGISGILAAINLPQAVRNLDLVMYDKNEELGGPWFENKYPGCACALEASWDEGAATWRVKLENVKTGEVFNDQGDALITAIGALNEWRWPQIPGLHDFGGKLLHSASWDESYDYKGKKVAVIGAESSGIHIVIMRGSDTQKDAREYFTQSMRDRLSKKPEVAVHMLPDFPPLCKRLILGLVYLEALTTDNVSVIPTSIPHVTSTGVAASDGTHRPVDAIVCATGFDSTFLNRFPIYGIHGILLRDRWSDRTSSYLSVTVDSFPSCFMSVGSNCALGTLNFIVVLECQSTYFASCMTQMQTQNILMMQPKSSAVDRFFNFCGEYFKGTVFSAECSSWYKSGKEGRVTI